MSQNFANRWKGVPLALALGFAALAVSGCTSGPGYGSYDSLGTAQRKASTVGESRNVAPIETRPGLGTKWGEYRDSHVSDAQFVRASSTPRSSTSIYYNDRDGLSAMIPGGRKVSNSKRSFEAWPASIEIRGPSRRLPSYQYGGKNYVAGDSGDRYEIVVKNRGWQRIEVVASVDGLDVVDGGSASTRKRGYVIAPRGSLTIEGWRRSSSGVAAFRFGTVSDSYSSRTGRGTRNVGVIGVAVFEEKASPVYHRGHEPDRRHAADPFPSGGRYAQPPR